MESFDNKSKIQIYSSTMDLKSEILQFIKECNVDICIVYSIRNNLALRILSINYGMSEISYKYSNKIDFKVNKESGIYSAYSCKKSIFNGEENTMTPFVGSVKYEIYIPIFSNEDVVGCVYLGSVKNKMYNIDINKISRIINEHIYEISNISSIELGYQQIIENLILMNEVFNLKSDYMVNHSYNVGAWAIQIAKKMNYSDDDLTKIYLAALTHDIGKIYIDENIINNDGKLTEKEYEEIKKHVDIGYNIAKNMCAFDKDCQIPTFVNEHHEKWDGTGYPNNLKGNETLQGSRILKIADSIDAILSERSYKKRMDVKEAITELKNCRGKDFDPDIVAVAIEVLSEKFNFSNKIIIDDILLNSNMIIKTNTDTHVFDGFILKVGSDVIFNSIKSIKDVEYGDIINVTIIFEKLYLLHEYDVKIKISDNNNILIYDIKSKEADNYFGLMWLLEGYYILPSSRGYKEISISKISGKGLTFSFSEEYELEENELTSILVKFEDGAKVPLMGKVVEKRKFSNQTYYNYEFVRLNESYRDEIFRQIFRKQISFKKLL